MRAITILDDPAHTMTWSDVPDPLPRGGEVIVRVHATAVNRADLLQRIGRYAPPPGASDIMGLECAGVVESVGEHVDPTWVGRRVCALLAGGGYAERVAVPHTHLLDLPPDMSFETAAAIPEVFYTAFVNLCLEGELQRGETALIHAAASGVGTAALQICRELGCRAIATASGGKLDALPPLGATHVVDRNTSSFLDVVREATNGRGVDVILDPVGAAYFSDDLAALALRGRLVVIGLLSGAEAQIDLNAMMRRRLRVIGSVLRSRSNDEKTHITERFREVVWPWLTSGRIAPVIDRVLPIEQVDEAHRVLKENRAIGKVVLRT